MALLQALNPGARVLPCTNSSVALKDVMGTGLFDFEKASQAAGWVQAMNAGGPVHSTSQYGISSFVYRARRPFHPGRLHSLLQEHFVLQEPDWSSAMSEAGDTEGQQEGQQAPGHVKGDASGDNRSVVERGAEVQARRAACFGQLLRSKGFVWLATRPDHCAEWSQAGSILRWVQAAAALAGAEHVVPGLRLQHKMLQAVCYECT